MARILVTGASTGLGLLTAASLCDAGHEVVLHARHPERIEDRSVLGKARGAVYGDLADLEAVRRIAEEADRYGRFDAVIHNAGVIRGPDIVAVNVIAPYALAALMERPARTIVVSSSLHRSSSPNHLSEQIAGRQETGYNDSKLFVTALVMGLARRWSDALVHAVCPGWVPTRMGGPSATDDLAEGHRTQAWLATAREAEIEPRTAGYWYHRAPEQPHPATLDHAVQDRLLAALAARTGIVLPE